MKMRIFVSLCVSALALAAVAVPCMADELDTMFAKMKEHVAAKNYSKALEEMRWMEKAIQKMDAGQVRTFFPDTVAGFTGGTFESNNVLGISNTERLYTKEGSAVKISLTGGSGGGGLAAFGKMAAMFGNQPGMDSVRISGRTAQMQEESGRNAELTVFLDSGSMLKFEGVGGANIDGTTLRTMAESMPIDALDGYLRGAK